MTHRELTISEITYARTLHLRALSRAESAMNAHPQPNYVLTKVAEEAGEVVKAGVHHAEGRDCTWNDLEDECVDTIAMCLRLMIEGDQVHGLVPPERLEEES